jgi:Protein of unknown function (DUF1441)
MTKRSNGFARYSITARILASAGRSQRNYGLRFCAGALGADTRRSKLRTSLGAIGISTFGNLRTPKKRKSNPRSTYPDRLDPFRRKAHWQAESAELRVAVDRGELVPRQDVLETYAAALKPIRLTLETLPDVLERDAGLSAHQVARAEKAIDQVREHLHADVLKELDRVRARA